ncbi:hypothetical protein DM82_4367 [Burkholderia oklahomensis]|uniref:Uncharacterized protein n=1 Tax=Burkholderia oklahomensis TaxID=342113 RepID=A0AAI8BD40_9BURK|nr:hypothetical protein DM82_4367 [Burkholderia oklahomensis]
MTAGLQAWDATGNLVFDATTRCGRVITLQRIAGGSGTFQDWRFTQGQPFACFHPDSVPWGGPNVYPNISYSGDTISFSYPAGNAMPGYLMMGVY